MGEAIMMPRLGAPPRAKRNSRGHLSREEIEYVLARWQTRRIHRGMIGLLSQELQVSHVTISNVILRETGLRPAQHPKPQGT